MEIGLVLLRLTAGLTLAAHGAQKLFGWFGGPGLDTTGQFFETIGFLPGRRHALMAGLAETGGGLLMALGLFTPIGAALICSVMLVAVTVHIKKGSFAQNGGYEYTLVLGVAASSVAFTGPGSLSLDALFGNTSVALSGASLRCSLVSLAGHFHLFSDARHRRSKLKSLINPSD
ncbi:MAG TPA: DoxX family protein [Terriglobales bacterium]|nr:DoxX family protein [Terriglobales bacterium]